MKKTSQSKKVMRQLDKERRRKAKGNPADGDSEEQPEKATFTGSELSNKPPPHGGMSATSGTDSAGGNSTQPVRNEISGKKIHTEIRTDDFVVRLLLSDNFGNLSNRCLVANPRKSHNV